MKVADTTLLIDIANGAPQAIKIAKDNETLLTTQINMFEFLRGVFQKGISERKYKELLEMFRNIRVLQLDDDSTIRSAHIWAELAKKGTPLPTIDCLISGIALSNGAKTIITQNTKHFSKVRGLKVESY